MEEINVLHENKLRVVNLCNAEELKENKCYYANRGVIVSEDRRIVEFINEKNPPVLKDNQQYGLLSLREPAYVAWNRGFYAKRIAEKFAEMGYTVSEEAITHNYDAWKAGLKSGYVDGNVFLYTPDGTNPLSFKAEEYTGEYYQFNYES